MSRSNIILIVILLLQLGLMAFVLTNEEESTTLARGGALVSGLDTNAVNRILIEDEERSLELQRDGEKWLLPQYGGFPVQSFYVQSRLSILAGFDADQIASRSDDALSRFQVAPDNFYRRVTLSTENGGSNVIYIGSTPDETTRRRFTRLDGENEVYINRDPGQGQLETDPTVWIDTLYFGVEPSTISQIEIQNENGTLTLMQQDGQWTTGDLAPNQALDNTFLSTLSQQLGSFRLDDPVERYEEADLAALGLDNPLATVTITANVPDPAASTSASGDELDDMTDGGARGADNQADIPTIEQVTTLIIGGTNIEDAFYIHYSENDYIVTLPRVGAEIFLNASRETLIIDAPYSIFGG